MDTITDINKSSLAGLLAALATAKMKVGSIANADGSYTVTYEPLLAGKLPFPHMNAANGLIPERTRAS